jgi:hypothetical protein
MIDIMLRNVVRHVSVFRDHTVVLFSPEDWAKALRMAGLYMPTGTENGGRTWRLPNGGMVTVAQYGDDPIQTGTFCVAAYSPELGQRIQLANWLKVAKKELSWQ